MDVYARQLLVKPHQDDLLREAADARLAREVEAATRIAPHRAFAARVEAAVVRPLRGIRISRPAPQARTGRLAHGLRG